MNDVFCAECVITIIVLIIHYYDSPSLIMINKYNNVCVVRKKKIMAYYCWMYFSWDTRMPLPPCVLLDFIGKHESCHTYILHFIESPACYLQTNTTKILWNHTKWVDMFNTSRKSVCIHCFSSRFFACVERK